MAQRRVIYRTPEYQVRFTVDENGETSGLGVSSVNGATNFAGTLNDVPIQALADFARQYGNVTVNTADLKAPGRKAQAEAETTA
jgi:hypothetical protein